MVPRCDISIVPPWRLKKNFNGTDPKGNECFRLVRDTVYGSPLSQA